MVRSGSVRSIDSIPPGMTEVIKPKHFTVIMEKFNQRVEQTELPSSHTTNDVRCCTVLYSIVLYAVTRGDNGMNYLTYHT